MKSRLLKVGLVLAGAALVGAGAAGCAAGETSDATACTTFNQVLSDRNLGLDGNAAAARSEVEAVTSRALEEAATPELKDRLEQFSKAFAEALDGDEDDMGYFHFTLTLLKLGETCEAAGVDLSGYTEIKRDLESAGMTIADLEQLSELNSLVEENGSSAGSHGFDHEALEEEASTDEVLLGLYTDCADGDMRACDLLYRDSEVNSGLQQFAEACGGHPDAADVNWCVDLEQR